jgi:hypothetical protein
MRCTVNSHSYTHNALLKTVTHAKNGILNRWPAVQVKFIFIYITFVSPCSTAIANSLNNNDGATKKREVIPDHFSLLKNQDELDYFFFLAAFFAFLAAFLAGFFAITF